MERLLELAKKKADKVEVYERTDASDAVSFENYKLKDIESSILSGVGLLVMKDGKLGYAYTRNLLDREGLVANALDALKGGLEADYDLPQTRPGPQLDTYDSGIEKLATTRIVDECERLCGEFQGRTKGQLNLYAGRGTTTVRVMNSSGTNLESRSSQYYCYATLLFPGSYSGISRMELAKGFRPFSREKVEYVLGFYNAGQKEVKPGTGPTRVLFLPQTMYTLVWRLQAAANGKSVYEQVSPLKDKVGEHVFSDKLTFSDKPLDDNWPDARWFDDEGTACQDTALVEAGVLKGFYFDRYYAWKAKSQPTGHGFRPTIADRVGPALEHLELTPGDKSLAQMLKEMGKGIIVGGALGAHSGNILNGDFSVGLAPGLCVENGEVVGQVKDAMVAGNIYETLKHVVAVGDEVEPAYMGRFPAVLFENVSVAVKG